MLSRLFFLLASATVLLLAFASIPTRVDGAHAFDAYRLIQYDKGAQTFGSRRTILNHQAIVEKSESSGAEWEKFDLDEDEPIVPAKPSDQDLIRKVVVVRIAELSPSKLRSIVTRGVTGLLIVLPKDLNSLSTGEIARYKTLERFLATRSWDAAIYFAFEDEYLEKMVENLQLTLEGKSSSDAYHIQVTTPDATATSGVNVHNFYGYQHAASTSTTDSDTLPTIGVVASYDSIAAVPGLGVGADQNASGAIAVLEVARIFNRLYADFRTQGSYNLLFILTSLDRMNYVATKNWLRNIDSRVLESLEFALCLERIASAEPLYFHVSKMPKTPEIQSIYSGFERTAKSMNIPFEIVHKKINISDSQVYWQHEQFSRKRIVAATLSSSRTPSIGFASGSMFDRAIDLAVLERNIHFIVESLSQQIYGLGKIGGAKANVRVLTKDDVNGHVLAGYANLFTSSSRFTSLVTDAKSNPLVPTLENYFNKFTSDFKKQTFSVDTILAAAGGITGGMKLYKDKDGGIDTAAPRVGVVEMHAFQVKPFLFDLYLLGGVLTYLLVIYIASKQPSNIGDVIAVLIGR